MFARLEAKLVLIYWVDKVVLLVQYGEAALLYYLFEALDGYLCILYFQQLVYYWL